MNDNLNAYKDRYRDIDNNTNKNLSNDEKFIRMQNKNENSNHLNNRNDSQKSYFKSITQRDFQFYCNSNSSQLSQAKRKHKDINKLLHIYSYKLIYNNIIKKSERSDSLKKLPFIENKKIKVEKTSYRSLSNTNKANVSNKRLISINEERLKLQKLKDKIKENREEKMRLAKENKEANRLMKENLIIFKNKLIEENKQKKKIVDANKKISLHSINTYKILKREFIHNSLIEEINKEKKVMDQKEAKLKSLKTTHNNQKNSLTLNKLTQKYKSNSLKSLYTKPDKTDRLSNLNTGSVFVTDINFKNDY